MPADSDVAVVLADRRRPAFCFQTLDALVVIREHFNGAKRVAALAIYTTMTEVANRHGGATARGSFKAVRYEFAEAAGVSLDTFDRYVKQFEELGLVEVHREKVGTANVANTWSLTDPEPPTSRTPTATPSRTGAAHRARDPLEEEERIQEGTAIAVLERPHDRPVKADGKPVTDDEYRLAHDVLVAFNESAGTRYSSADWIGRIVLRIREHPELTFGDHAVLIRRVFATPWWRDAPTPSVVYGNPRIFERSMHQVGSPQAKRGLTGEEMESYGTVWGPGTPYASPEDARAAAVNAVEADYEEVPE